MDPLTFAVALIAFCNATRGSVTSWGRSERRNAMVGGVPTSHHRTFTGADVVYDDAIPLAEVQVIAAHLDLMVIREIDHDHLQPLKKG